MADPAFKGSAGGQSMGMRSQPIGSSLDPSSGFHSEIRGRCRVPGTEARNIFPRTPWSAPQWGSVRLLGDVGDAGLCPKVHVESLACFREGLKDVLLALA